MTEPQSPFLDRLRRILARPGQERADSWAMLQNGDSDRPGPLPPPKRSREERLDLLDRLTEEAKPLHLQIHRCSSLADAAERISAIATTREPEFSATRELILHDHPLLARLPLESLTEAGIRTHRTAGSREGIRRHTLDAFIGVTVATWGIAESATIVQLTLPGQPRSTSLVPSIHIALLPLDRLVASLAEAYAAIALEPASSMVLISGPSKTADIEAHMVLGAHGPREMHLLVLDCEKSPSTP